MIGKWALPLLLAAQTAAAASGSWSGEGANLVVSQRGIAGTSPAMRAPANIPPGHVITSIHWTYRLQGTPPRGLRVALCTVGRCVQLEGGSGGTQALQGVDAGNPLQLLFHLPGKGPVKPPVRVLTYQVLVNYAARQ